MKKRIFAILLCFSCLLVFIGCSQKEGDTSKSNPEFMDVEWLFYDEVSGENLIMKLGSDGSYAYYCQCGEPVGNSDVYDTYKYEETTGMITLFSSSGNEKDTIEVLDFNTQHLMLRVDGEMKDFTRDELDTRSNFYSYEGESYFEGYTSRGTIVESTEGNIVFGPYEYDPEGLNEDGPFEEYKLAEHAVCFDLSVSTYLSVEDGQECEESYDVAFTEIGLVGLAEMMEYGSGAAFLWLNDAMQVEKIVFFGETRIQN